MLFNSPEFLFLFLPAVAAGYFVLGARLPAAARIWLVVASLAFYGWWNPAYLPLLVLSLAVNHAFGGWLARPGTARRRLLRLWLGLGLNLAVLGYYKYAAFAARTLDGWLGTAWPAPHPVLPLGISFFTFLQITYLVDLYRREPVDRDPGGYALFVTFFPHLLAGPIIHHREMMPQFARRETYRFSAPDAAVGLALFTLGLAKKVLIADGMAGHANEVFAAAARPGAGIAPAALWFGALAYTFQLYFDFSGYSDMAIGLARMFGIRFPENFDSPYKAGSLVEFWRRWHMTLSRLLRDYVYIPLGGNRLGKSRRAANLLATMLLAGLWHGAGWTYVVWGGAHGAGLLAGHAWDDAARRPGRAWLRAPAARLAGWAATFLFVVAAWVVFRAADLPTAGRMLRGMFCWQPTPGADLGLAFRARHWLNLPLLLAVVLFCPNTREIVGRFAPVLRSPEPGPRRAWQWAPTAAWGALLAALFAYAVLSLGNTREFLYYQF